MYNHLELHLTGALMNTIVLKVSIKIEALPLFLIPDSNLTPPNMIHTMII